MASLFVMQGRDRGKRFELLAELTLGRDGSNLIQLNDSEVSRQHARVRKEEAGFTLTDLGSSNGSFVNNEPVKERLLKTGDRVMLGRSLMLFTDTQEHSSQNLAHEVDIVGELHTSGSRIHKSVGQEESQIFRVPDSADSPWLARARSNLQIMYRTALAVSHTLDIDQLLHRIMELIFEWVEADRGLIMLSSHETGELEPAVSRNRKGTKADEKLSVSRTILDYVLQHKEGVLTSDAKDDERWDPANSIL
ncbi:MAG: FHA domain-containing protein, partial [Planctomycetales bacterium]|nr:FHA domain-containing protein [Planctomycetales bacterium]